MRALGPLAAMLLTATVTCLVVPLAGSAQALTIESTIGFSSKGLSSSFSGPSFKGGVFYRVARTIGLGVEVGTGERGVETQVRDPFSCVIGLTGDPTTCTAEATLDEDTQYAVLTLRVVPTAAGSGVHFDGGLGVYRLRVRTVSTTFDSTDAVVDHYDFTSTRKGLGAHLGTGMWLEIPGTPASLVVDGRYHFVLTTYSGGPDSENHVAVAFGARVGVGP